MKCPEPQGEGANNDVEMTVYNNTNEKLYSVLFFTPPLDLPKLP